jgi:TolB-like protein
MALAGTSKGAFGWLLASALGVAGLLLAWFFFSGHAGLLFNQRVAGGGPTQKSIAVLPFENISANKDDAYFADGVQDEILNNLAKIAQLKVISRTSVMQYRGDNKRDLRQIASTLGVANVLEGTVRRDGNHVRVSTELVDAHHDNTIWADSYDRHLCHPKRNRPESCFETECPIVPGRKKRHRRKAD